MALTVMGLTVMGLTPQRPDAAVRAPDTGGDEGPLTHRQGPLSFYGS